MNTPSVGTHPGYLETLRIGGGFNSTPDGGLDCDAAGNLALDGDLTVGGEVDLRGGVLHNSAGDLALNACNDTANSVITLQNTSASHQTEVLVEGNLQVNGALTLGANGTDKTWFLPLNIPDAFIHSTQGPSGPYQMEYGGGFNTVYQYLDYAPDVKQFAHWNIFLPADYDGSALKVKLFWTATAGTTGEVVRWRAHAACLDNGSTLNSTLTNNVPMDSTFQAANQLHTVEGALTPDNASNGGMLALLIYRQGDSVTDTLPNAAQLIGARISLG